MTETNKQFIERVLGEPLFNRDYEGLLLSIVQLDRLLEVARAEAVVKFKAHIDGSCEPAIAEARKTVKRDWLASPTDDYRTTEADDYILHRLGRAYD